MNPGVSVEVLRGTLGATLRGAAIDTPNAAGRGANRARRTLTRALAWIASITIIGAAALAAHGVAMQSGIDRLREAAGHRLDMVGAGLESDLARFEYLPSLLEMTPSVFALLDAPLDRALQVEVNRYLQGVNATAGAANLYVLDRSGMALAASDWDDPGTPVGTDLSFRPYVKEALAHGRGRFYGVGITSKRAGYYLSYALQHQGRLRGVATVKVDLEEAEATWKNLPGNVVLVDERGVVILSSRSEWKFRPLAPLTPSALAEIAGTRPYGDAKLEPLDLREPVGGATRFLTSERPLRRTAWRLIALDDTAPVAADARNFAITAGLGTSVLLLLLTVAWQRQRAVRHKLANRAALQAAHDSLEAKVVERTAELRAAHAELVHAGKMAVLGQMSAGMVHELNQPLGAMRTLSDNACVLLDQYRLGDVRGNLERIAQLVDRLGRLTHQLKAFAHKGNAVREAVDVRQAVTNAQFLVSQRLRDNSVEMVVDIAPGLRVLAQEPRLEQVLVNLLGNAIDAMAASPTRRLRVVADDSDKADKAQADDDACSIRVIDTGPGIRADILPHLFEPFVTTKPAGAGLGLGLMISAHIVREWGGGLRAFNMEGGGACFAIELSVARVREEVAHE